MAGMYALLLAVLVLSSFQMFSAALNEESEDFSDWRDPTDMINYDLATGKMRNSEVCVVSYCASSRLDLQVEALCPRHVHLSFHLSVHPFFRSFVWYQSCEGDILKTSETIWMQIGKSGPQAGAWNGQLWGQRSRSIHQTCEGDILKTTPLSWVALLVTDKLFWNLFLITPNSTQHVNHGWFSGREQSSLNAHLSSRVRRHGTSYHAPSATLHPWTVSRGLWKHFCLHLISDCTLHFHCCMHRIFSISLRFTRRPWIGHHVTSP